MDMSKLPQLSNTRDNAPPPQADQPPARAPIPVQAIDAPSGAEAWISIAIGIIVLGLTSRFFQFLASRLGGTAFTWVFNDANGNPLSYSQTVFFWNDIGIVAFGLALILDGVVLAFIRRRIMVLATFLLTLAAIGLNVFTIIKSMPILGFQILPALAIAFGVYIGIYQWAMLKSISRLAPPSSG